MKKTSDNNSVHNMPLFMCLGISIGVGIGAATNNIPIGMCIGIGVGTCVGSILDLRARKDAEEKEVTEKDFQGEN